jgi:NADPH2:quinone reductase
VIATGGSAAKVARCRELGADAAVNYRTEDLASALRQFAPDGVDVFWETLREPDFDEIVGYLAERGKIVLMAGRDARPPFPVGPFYVKGCSLHGFVMFKASPDEQRVCAEDINRWLRERKLTANISHVLPLAEAARAHRLQEESTVHKSGEVAGKIVVLP